MNIPIDQFEQHISETILKRGLGYYKKGAVTGVEELEPNIYFAEVEGSESYEVEIRIKNNLIKDIDCSCPYDDGICKHAVAVLFTIQAETLKLEDPQMQALVKTTKGKLAKEKTPKEQLDLLLQQLNKDELIKSILEIAVKDKTLLYQLLSKHSYLNHEQTQSFYDNQVKNLIKSAKGRDGFIDYYSVRKLNKSLQELLHNAEVQVGQPNKQGAIYAGFAIIKEISLVLDNIDDSDGDAYYFVEAAFDLLYSIIKDDSANADYLTEIFEISMEKIKSGTGQGFDIYNSLLRLATDTISNKEQIEVLIPYLSANTDSKYENEFRTQLEYDLIVRFEGVKKAEEFLMKHLHHPAFRKTAIDAAIAKKEYVTAKTYAKQGVSLDKEYAGLISDWQNYLLKIAELENDKKTIIELALYLFTNNHYNFDYYNRAKKHASASEWQNIVNDILKKFASEKYWKPYDLIARIHFEEKKWNLLLDTLKEYASFELLEKYENVLSETYSKELITLYERSIRNYLEKHIDRKYYQVACTAIRRLKKLIPGGNVNYLINEFRIKYKSRRVLIELINKI